MLGKQNKPYAHIVEDLEQIILMMLKLVLIVVGEVKSLKNSKLHLDSFNNSKDLAINAMEKEKHLRPNVKFVKEKR